MMNLAQHIESHQARTGSEVTASTEGAKWQEREQVRKNETQKFQVRFRFQILYD
jgi:hypothetical protein